MTVLRNIFATLTVAIMLTACDSVDSNRIPAMPVNIVFQTVGSWDYYGVSGALDTRRFIRTSKEQVPANFPYTVSTYTGFGGVLLCGDLYGNPVAYDLACPVECRADVRIQVDHDLNVAYCPTCGSTYAIFDNYGAPLSGLAAERGYGLQRYHVRGGTGSVYRVITR